MKKFELKLTRQSIFLAIAIFVAVCLGLVGTYFVYQVGADSFPPKTINNWQNSGSGSNYLKYTDGKYDLSITAVASRKCYHGSDYTSLVGGQIPSAYKPFNPMVCAVRVNFFSTTLKEVSVVGQALDKSGYVEYRVLPIASSTINNADLNSLSAVIGQITPDLFLKCYIRKDSSCFTSNNQNSTSDQNGSTTEGGNNTGQTSTNQSTGATVGSSSTSSAPNTTPSANGNSLTTVNNLETGTSGTSSANSDQGDLGVDSTTISEYQDAELFENQLNGATDGSTSSKTRSTTSPSTEISFNRESLNSTIDMVATNAPTQASRPWIWQFLIIFGVSFCVIAGGYLVYLIFIAHSSFPEIWYARMFFAITVGILVLIFLLRSLLT